MSFREKTAWITLVSLTVGCLAYYGAILSGVVPQTSRAAFHLGALAVVCVVVLQAVLNLIAAFVSARDERNLRDERERLIHARSHVVGYYVLMAGLVGTLVFTHLPQRGDGFVDVVVRTVNIGGFALVLAAVAVAVAQIVMYRRGI